MPYLTREEQAMLTLKDASPSGLASQSGSIGLGIMLGTASNILFAATAGVKLKTMTTDIRTYSGKNLALAMRLSNANLDAAITEIMNTIDKGFNDIIGLTVDGLLASVGGMYASLRDNFAATSTLLNSYNGIIQSIGIDPYITRAVNSKVQPNIPEAQTAWFMRKIGALNDAQYHAVLVMNGWNLLWKDVLDKAWTQPPSIEALLNISRRGGFPVDDFKAQLRWYRISESMIDKVAELIIQAPEPYRTADFAAKGLIDDAQLRGAFKWSGFPDGWDTIWAKSQMLFPDFQTGLNLLWRGAIDVNKLKSWLKRTAISDDAIESMMVLSEQIPPSNDLVTMVVREAWEPANVTPAPEIFAKYMAMRGFNKDWSDRYWTAHWLPMGIQYGYANLHRGFWSKEQFDDLLRIADIHPRWRDAIYNVAYNPPSIREMGYGYDVGAYTKEDIIKYRRWGGLSEVDANKAGLAMVAYRTEAEREAVRREYLNLYQLGKITDDEFTQELTAIGTAIEAIPLWVERGQLRRSALAFESSILEPKAMTRTDAQWLFEHGVYDETWLRSAMLNLGYEAETVESYILQSKQKLTEKVTPLEPKKLTLAQLRTLYSLKLLNEEQYTARIVSIGYTAVDAQSILQATIESLKIEPKVAKYNELSKSELGDLYYYGFISRPEFVNRMVSNGYAVEDAELLVTLYVFEQQLGDIKTLYSKGWITKNQMRDEFLDMGLSEDVAIGIMMLIIKAEAPMRIATEKDLTKAEIVKGAKAGIIATSSAVSLLMDLGYDEDEAWYILAINKVIAAGDPEGYWDMRKVTEAYKKARGEPSVDIPQELIDLEREQRSIKWELDQAKAAHETEVKIGEIAVRLASVNSRLATITSKLSIK